MQDWLISIMEQFGYIGVLLLITFESVFPPIPSEIILTFAGFMTASANMSVPVMILFATMGSLVGAIVLYYVGRILGRPGVEKIIDKHGKILGVKRGDLKKALLFYRKYQYPAIFFCRLIPIVRSLISIPAGMAKMKMPHFLLLTMAGSLLWNSILIIAGYILGDSWHDIMYYLGYYDKIIYAAFGVIAVLIIVYLVKNRKR